MRKKGISTIIALLIFIIILISIIVPVSTIVLSKPTVNHQQLVEFLPYKNIAEQQQEDVCPIVPTQNGKMEPPVNFIYTMNKTVVFIFNDNGTLPIPLIIKYLLVFNGETWVQLNIIKQGNMYIATNNEIQQSISLCISPINDNSEYYGNPVILIQLSVQPYLNAPNYVVAVTQYGNMIYAQSS